MQNPPHFRVDLSRVPYLEGPEALYRYLVEIMKEKLAVVPPIMRPDSITIKDIITNNSSRLKVVGIPLDVQTDHFLVRYNDLRILNFIAWKYGCDKQATRLIWYWGLDRYHSFAVYHEQSRYNLFLMLLVKAAPANAIWASVDQKKKNFCSAYIHACIATALRSEDGNVGYHEDLFIDIWFAEDLDLVHFSPRQMKRMKEIIHAVFQHLPPTPFQVTSFLSESTKLHASQFDRWGPGWALQYLKEIEAELEESRAERLENMDQATIGETEACMYLSDPKVVNSPWVQLALRPIPENIQPRPKPTSADKARSRWVDPDLAMNQIQEDKPSLELLLSNLRI